MPQTTKPTWRWTPHLFWCRAPGRWSSFSAASWSPCDHWPSRSEGTPSPPPAPMPATPGGGTQHTWASTTRSRPRLHLPGVAYGRRCVHTKAPAITWPTLTWRNPLLIFNIESHCASLPATDVLHWLWNVAALKIERAEKWVSVSLRQSCRPCTDNTPIHNIVHPKVIGAKWQQLSSLPLPANVDTPRESNNNLSVSIGFTWIVFKPNLQWIATFNPWATWSRASGFYTHLQYCLFGHVYLVRLSYTIVRSCGCCLINIHSWIVFVIWPISYHVGICVHNMCKSQSQGV